MLRTNIGGVSSDFSTKHLAKTFKKWEQFLFFKKYIIKIFILKVVSDYAKGIRFLPQNSNFLIPIIYSYFKLWLFDLTEFIVCTI